MAVVLRRVAAVLSLVMVVTGCGSQATSPKPAAAPAAPSSENVPTSGSKPSAPPTKVKVSSLVSTASTAWFVADELKLGQKYGIDFEFKIFQDPEQKNSAFAAGETPISTVNTLAGAQMRSEGLPASLIYGLVTSANPILVKRDFPGATIADLKGKRVGMSSRTGSHVPIFQQMAREVGFDWLKDTQVSTAPPPALPELLKSGKVDAVEIWDPQVSRLLGTGEFKILVHPKDWYGKKYGENYATVSVVARDDFLSKEPEAVRAFLAMTKEAAEWVKAHPLEAARIFAKAAKITDEPTIKALSEQIPPTLTTQWDSKTVEALQPYLTASKELGLIRSMPGPDLFRFEFAPKP